MLDVKNGPRTLDKASFLKCYSISEDVFGASGLDWPLLCQIYDHATELLPSLAPVLNFAQEELRRCDRVHSVRARLKNPEHLIEKLIRKAGDKAKKGERLEISVDNYSSKVTDLIGLRALHLFKEDWLAIHEFVKETWDLVEKPVANIRKGDSPEIVERFRGLGCEIYEHPAGYRSVHYLISQTHRKNPVVCEIQVRTLFEEAWSEIDHAVRYPYGAEPLLSQFLVMFNRLAGSSDEMGSFVMLLKESIAGLEAAHLKKVDDYERAIAEMKQKIDRLHVAEKEKAALQEQLTALREGVPPLQAENPLAAVLVLLGQDWNDAWDPIGSRCLAKRSPLEDLLRRTHSTSHLRTYLEFTEHLKRSASKKTSTSAEESATRLASEKMTTPVDEGVNTTTGDQTTKPVPGEAAKPTTDVATERVEDAADTTADDKVADENAHVTEKV